MTSPASLVAMARQRLLAERLAQRGQAAEDLLEFIPRVSHGRWEAPVHLMPVIELARRIERGEPVRAVVSTPPRHGKTTTWLSALVWILRRHPDWPVAYVTYAAELAQSKSYEARALAGEAGVSLAKDRANLGEWLTENGGGMVATGVGGALTGRGFRFLLADDPFKGRAEADSPLIRERTWEWFNAVAFTRQHPDGTAYVVNGTRWHPDDLSGRLLRHGGWEHINLPAIRETPNGERALWPAKYGVAALRAIEQQIGPYEFGALYQGEPRQRGSSVFNEPTVYDALPVGVGYRTSIGCDFAYTVRSWSDFNVAVVLRRYTTGDTYVVDVVRERCELPAFRLMLRRLADQHGSGATMRAFVSGTEKGGLQFFAEGPQDERVFVEPMAAVGDKFQRAQPVAAAWNAGRVLVPRDAPWLPAFLDEVRAFTGVRDPHDDQIDAMAGAFEPLRMMVDGGGDEAADTSALDGDDATRWGGQRGF